MRILLLPVAALLLAACSSDDTSCAGTIVQATQNQSIVTATGKWSGGNPFMVVSVNGGSQHVAPTTNTDSTATFNLTSFALGQYGVLWALTCGDKNSDEVTMTGPATVTLE